MEECDMASVRDLKLKGQRKATFTEDGKRKSRKFYQIKRAADDKKIYQNFTVKNKLKNKIDKQMILKSLSSHFIFSSLTNEKHMQDLLLQKFSLCKIIKGQYLMKQNDNASSFFILHEGSLNVQINGQSKRKIVPGQGFGELALLYSAPRSASIKALQTSLLWFIDRSTFRSTLQTMIQKSFKQNRKFIQQTKFFKSLTSDQKDKIASISISQRYSKNKSLVKQGDLASSMFILKSGRLCRTKNGNQVGILKPGDCFDQYATLSKNSVRKQTIVALEDSEVIAFATEDIQSALGNGLSFIVLRNRAKQALNESGLFKDVPQEYIQKVVDCFKITKFSRDQKVVKKGSPCRQRIFLIIEGKYEIIGNRDIKKTLIGCQSLIEANANQAWDYQLIFKQDGKIAQFSYNSFTQKIGRTYQQLLSQGKKLQKIIERQEDERKQKKNEALKIKLGDFQAIKKLGSGQFGVVYLVTDSKKNNFFALKCISKMQAIKARLEKHLMNEKEVLQSVNNPFIMEYFRSYKDQNFIYFLTEFINGLELFDAIRVIGLLDVKQSIFYGAVLLLALQAMHQKNIIYRDLKPQNVMVGQDGYLKIIDMGACKRIQKNSVSQKTYTIIGTPNYMAPEVLAGTGYNYLVDLWSLGIMLFEFMGGFVPFGEDLEDPYQIYEQILKTELKFPANMTNKNANDFIKLILNKKPEMRLAGSYANLKDHPFFSGMNWTSLIDKKIVPPYKLPKDKFVNIEKIKDKVNPLQKVLKISNKSAMIRKGLDPKWDQAF